MFDAFKLPDDSQLLRRGDDQIKIAPPGGDDKFAPGRILYNSWGYDQTNIDFYQITRRTEKSIWFRPIGCEMVANGHMSGRVTPIPDSFAGPEEMRRLQHRYGEPYIRARHGFYHPYEGKPLYCSWYA